MAIAFHACLLQVAFYVKARLCRSQRVDGWRWIFYQPPKLYCLFLRVFWNTLYVIRKWRDFACCSAGSAHHSLFIEPKNYVEILGKERVFDRGKGKLENAKGCEH